MKINNQITYIIRGSFTAIFLLGFIVFAGAANEARAQSGTICSMPGTCQPVFKFSKWDLAFSTGRQSKFKAGETAESNEFYAIILDSAEIGFSEGDYCADFSEAKRLAAQKIFPKNKVFASHYCGDKLPTIIYKGFGDWREHTFLAVFLGEISTDATPSISQKDAQAFLAKAKKNYPKAELRKMTVRIDYTDEK